jgi:hypothetical protein
MSQAGLRRAIPEFKLAAELGHLLVVFMSDLNRSFL